MNNTLPMRRRLLFVGVFFTVSALMVEIGARVFTPYRAPEPAIPQCVGRVDSRLGWALQPGARGISHRTGQAVEYQINSKGLRDDESPYEKPNGVFRIALLGDSRTFGFGIPIEKHYSALLEQYFDNVEVINLGVSGFGIDQELLFLRSEGFRYQPDLVVAYVAHFGGHRHMHTNRFGKNKPRFKFVNEALVLTNCPVPRNAPTVTSTRSGNGPTPEVQASHGATPTVGITRRIHHLLRKHSRAYEILRTGIVRLIEPEALAPRKAQRLADRKNLQDGAFETELYELGEAIIQAMHDDTEKHGATFVLATQIARLHDAVSTRGINSLDASEAMSNPTFPISEELLHINEAGNGVLAWVIADYLIKQELIPPQHRRSH